VSQIFKKLGQFVFFLALGVGLMYWIYIRQESTYKAYCAEHGIPSEQCKLSEKLWSDLLSINPVYILLIFIAFFLSNFFRSLRWRMLLRSVGYEIEEINSIGPILVGYLANLGLPRSGEFIRAALLSRYEKVPLTVSVGTVVLDRLIDLMSMGMIVTITVFIEHDTFLRLYHEQLSQISLVEKLILPGIAVLAILVLFFTRNKWRDLPAVANIKKRLRGFLDGVLSIRNIEHKGRFLLYTLMIWVWFFVMMYLALRSYGPTSSLPITSALVIYVFGSLGMLVPTPGGMGSYHFLVILALSYYGIHEVDAFSFANISFFSANFANNLTLGLGAMLVMYLFNRKPGQIQSNVNE